MLFDDWSEFAEIKPKTILEQSKIMIASLLLVSADDFPIALERQLEKSEFSCFQSRGVIKTREILNKQQIDAIVWVFMGHESALAKDLLKVFNQHMRIPIVFITQSYDELDFAEDIKSLYANLDLNDDISDIVRTIETACNQSIIKEQEPVIEDTNEIEFKNALSQFASNSSETTNGADQSNKLNKIELWEAVDRNEKQILAGIPIEEVEKKESIFPKLKGIIKKKS